MSLERIVKSHIRSLEPYRPGKPSEELERELGIEGSIKLASNENPLGPSPRAVAAVRGALEEVHRYPDGASYALREALSTRLDSVIADTIVSATVANAMIIPATTISSNSVNPLRATFIEFSRFILPPSLSANLWP